ncbi:hypothetical protein FHR32_004365 [Streptosporangium album]|uniref:Uncharacterized protein n=1 Tax=Streptosporangium album TaxID=47479 RepID=A0A7W7RXL2_9ACTN|nr:hypothetical protein [Streptosporangium album]MBB4940060.1 hypothetical protein [Streptosporangium album]
MVGALPYGSDLPCRDSPRPRKARTLPVFDSGRPLTAEAMDDVLYEHIKERAARR